MQAIVVVESMFGNTREVAAAIARGITAAGADVTVADVDGAPTRMGELDLLVAGGPTHAFGLSRKATREAAVEKGAEATSGAVDAGLRDWLGVATPGASVIAAAAFDTRIKKRGVPGSAARTAHRLLRRAGFRVIAPPTSFWVEQTSGPLTTGEVDRAVAWGTELVETLRR